MDEQHCPAHGVEQQLPFKHVSPVAQQLVPQRFAHAGGDVWVSPSPWVLDELEEHAPTITSNRAGSVKRAVLMQSSLFIQIITSKHEIQLS